MNERLFVKITRESIPHIVGVFPHQSRYRHQSNRLPHARGGVSSAGIE